MAPASESQRLLFANSVLPIAHSNARCTANATVTPNDGERMR